MTNDLLAAPSFLVFEIDMFGTRSLEVPTFVEVVERLVPPSVRISKRSIHHESCP